MKRLIFLFALLVGGLMATAQPLQRTVVRATEYLQADTLKSINATSVSVDGNRVTDLADPVDPQDAVTLKMLQDSLATAGGTQTAAEVPYSNTTSGLSATDVQAAVDELDAAIEAAAAGGVVSINGETGIVVIDTDDIAEGATNEYYTEAKVAANAAVSLNTAKETNATHTGEVTGSAALTITPDVVDYGKVATTLKGEITDNDGAWDWSAAGLINAAISTNTTVTFSNLQIVKQLRIRLTLSAGATITWPAYVTVQGATLGDGTFKIYADCWNSGSGTEDVLINIIAE